MTMQEMSKWLEDTDYTKYIVRNGDKVFIDKPNTKRMVGCHEGIQNVIFNGPATIVLWTDGTKTVVKCQDDDWWDPEKGLAMAIVKKVYGNKGNYCNEVKRWLPAGYNNVQSDATDMAYGDLVELIGYLLGLSKDEQKKALGE